ncbi:MAG: flippase-like domain-containing protein [Alphaproteobacteria bacterium]|nr:flippase-like domain-containing protein [Alphaproteobacteria bacterium]
MESRVLKPSTASLFCKISSKFGFAGFAVKPIGQEYCALQQKGQAKICNETEPPVGDRVSGPPACQCARTRGTAQWARFETAGGGQQLWHLSMLPRSRHPDCHERRILHRFQVIALAIGLAAAVAVIGVYGFSDISAAVFSAGWGIVWLVGYHALPLFADAMGWATLIRQRPAPSFGMLYLIRWISESVNNLMPVAQVGGEFVRARLAQKEGCRGAEAGASVVIDVTMGLFALMAFSLIGVALLVWKIEANDQIFSIVVGVLIFFALILGFYFAQRAGMIGRAGELTARIGGLVGTDRLTNLVGGTRRLDDALHAIYRQRARLASCAALRLASFVIGSGEVWIGLNLLGYPGGIADAVIINAITMAVRSAAFAIPGGLGAQEGGFLIVGTMLGLSPEISLALALLRRVREILFGVPGLAIWWLLENRTYGHAGDSARD